MSQAVYPAEMVSERAPESSAYQQAVARLYALGQELAPLPPLPDGTPAPRRKWDLQHMRTLCTALGEPQRRFPAVLIAGTNGKGSTAATLASILAAAGHRTGLYTSPHLVRVNERIQILTAPDAEPAAPFRSLDFEALDAGSEIPDADFARLFARVEETAAGLVATGELPHSPSFFEILTALAFLHFAEAQVDIAVLEVGLGGRLDATNVVEPVLSVITDIALDHQEYLGDTIAAITREKAGILRPNGVLVTLPQHPEANQAIGEAAATLDLRAINAAEYIPAQTHDQMPTHAVVESHGSGTRTDGVQGPVRRNSYVVSVGGEPLLVDSPLAGHHQQRNIALAIAAAVELGNQGSYSLANAALEAGIRNTRWPGRLEMLPPNLLLDVAHNPAGAWALRAALAQLPEERPRTLIFSCLADKDLREISRILFPLFDSSLDGGRPHDHIVLAPIANPRAAKVEELLAAAHALDVPAHAAPHIAAALAQARAVTPPGGLIVATGSVYLVGAVRELAARELRAAHAVQTGEAEPAA